MKKETHRLFKLNFIMTNFIAKNNAIQYYKIRAQINVNLHSLYINYGLFKPLLNQDTKNFIKYENYLPQLYLLVIQLF